MPDIQLGARGESPKSITTVWLTPPEILDALGKFDLDPCACCEPRPWPTANEHFTKSDDGLSRAWHGRVWLNPPYGAQTMKAWMRKMAQHNQGIALIFARTETALFHECVWNSASAALFLKGRLTFRKPDGSIPKSDNGSANSGAPSVLVAYGKRDADILRTCGLSGAFVDLSADRPAMQRTAAPAHGEDADSA